jgi:hypothetical protein
MRFPVVVVVAVTVAGSSSCLELDRVDDLRPGDVRLVVERDGRAVGGAVVQTLNTRVTATDRNGEAQLQALPVGQWPVFITLDDDGDGVADAAAIDGRPAVVDGGTALTADFTGFDLGTVELSPTGTLSGTAPSCAPDELCRVVVLREVVDGEGNAITLPIEASTGVGTDGAWRFDGLAAGSVTVVGFAWPRSAQLPLVAATRPTRFGVVNVDVGASDVVVDITSAAAPTPTTLSFRGAVDALERATGELNFFVPTAATQATVDGAASPVTSLSGDAPSTTTSVPAGLVDVRAQLDVGVGALFNVVLVPDAAPLVAMAIGTSICSAVDRGVDCNGDGVSDVVELDGAGDVDLGDVDLDNNGVPDVADTDLDHDGVADATEPAACRVIGLGADRDADCLCDLVDPFPDCFGNDPAACGVGVGTCE